MDKNKKAAPKVAEIAVKIVGLLEPLSPEDRQKAIKASLILLGETTVPGAPGPGPKPDHDPGSLPPKATIWMNHNGLTRAQLERVFDISGGEVSIIAAVPGKSDKAKTHNAYVLQGVSRVLASGDNPVFDDKIARELCRHSGCYDKTNHARYMSGKGNVLTGSKTTGWKLTAPGLAHAAELIKELTKEK
jgi:hypothetical protein